MECDGYKRIRIPTEQGVDAVARFLEEHAEPADITHDSCMTEQYMAKQTKAGVPSPYRPMPLPYKIPETRAERQKLMERRANTLVDLLRRSGKGSC